MFRAITIALLVISASSVQASDNQELSRMATADQQDRSGEDQAWDDDARRKRVLELLAAGAVVTPHDKLNAALILQHTPGTVCEGQLRSASPENYLLAHHLARVAFDAGIGEAGPMVAMTIDRYLAFTEARQRYGTTQLLDLSTGEMYMPEVDRSVTDEERAALGLPPLSALLKAAPERKAPSSASSEPEHESASDGAGEQR